MPRPGGTGSATGSGPSGGGSPRHPRTGPGTARHPRTGPRPSPGNRSPSAAIAAPHFRFRRAAGRAGREIFVPSSGARPGARRILIVVTDGEKYGDSLEYPAVIAEAERGAVTRYAIGVGSAFSTPAAQQELRVIASSPAHDHVFRVDNFAALGDIQSQLQEKIFAIEGYSAVPVALGNTWGLALGAPRYAHLGRVLVLQPGHTWTILAEATGPQVGSYFGASLLALQPCPGEPRPGRAQPGETPKLLVGAPLFYGGGSGGRVDLCELQRKSSHLRCHLSLRGSPGQPLGRFGASLAHLGDLDGDRCAEVAVGAPLEDDGQGAIYLFRGTPGGVSTQGVQRIPGSTFPSQPHFFGQSLSGGRDLSGDDLPDLAVGARGQVLLLRSPPLLQVRLQVSFQPQVIPASAFECPEGEELRTHLATAKLCFIGAKKTRDGFGESP
ncbi:PREDICTED: integrin alpha-X-like, partial [Sturnus vulgaris]|uniref:integrin alpha-X-like n=1 Tax=Sturnus vulgaris TaxID=9172 RepID=UPI00071A8AEF